MPHVVRVGLSSAALLALVASALPAAAKPARPAPAHSAPPAPAEPAAEAEPEPAAPPGLSLHFVDGPSSVDLGHALTLALPATDRFLAHDDADKVLKKMGNLHNESVLGMVIPTRDEDDWFVVIDWTEDGHVADEETIDDKALLEDMRGAQKEANEERVAQGFPELTIDGFQVAPKYEKASHHLSWALTVSSPKGKSVNFNTRILGRASYVSINLVTDPGTLETYRGEAMTLLDATTFAKGQRYEDFDKKTDKVAEYGLAGLIAGGAGLGALKLVKLGLLAKFGKVLLGLLIAGKKALVLAVAGAWAAVKRFFSGKKRVAASPAGDLPQGPPAP